MVMSCQEIWREISNYIDGDLSPELRAQLEVHLAGCRHCAALLDSTRNVVVLIADERTFELPSGFSERLHARLANEMASD
jgi:anti-sigma factor (TIGR02949 family)